MFRLVQWHNEKHHRVAASNVQVKIHDRPATPVHVIVIPPMLRTDNDLMKFSRGIPDRPKNTVAIFCEQHPTRQPTYHCPL